jgi:hypothetical protein
MDFFISASLFLFVASPCDPSSPTPGPHGLGYHLRKGAERWHLCLDVTCACDFLLQPLSLKGGNCLRAQSMADSLLSLKQIKGASLSCLDFEDIIVGYRSHVLPVTCRADLRKFVCHASSRPARSRAEPVGVSSETAGLVPSPSGLLVLNNFSANSKCQAGRCIQLGSNFVPALC